MSKRSYWYVTSTAPGSCIAKRLSPKYTDKQSAMFFAKELRSFGSSFGKVDLKKGSSKKALPFEKAGPPNRKASNFRQRLRARAMKEEEMYLARRMRKLKQTKTRSRR